MRQTCMFLSTIVSKASMAGVSSVTLMTGLKKCSHRATGFLFFGPSKSMCFASQRTH